MVMDEGNLVVTLNGLEALESKLKSSLVYIVKVREILKTIEIVGNERPVDYYTGNIMTDARREEIYNSCIAEAERILSEYRPESIP